MTPREIYRDLVFGLKRTQAKYVIQRHDHVSTIIGEEATKQLAQQTVLLQEYRTKHRIRAEAAIKEQQTGTAAYSQFIRKDLLEILDHVGPPPENKETEPSAYDSIKHLLPSKKEKNPPPTPPSK